MAAYRVDRLAASPRLSLAAFDAVDGWVLAIAAALLVIALWAPLVLPT